MFTGFSPYDDEGYLLVSLKSFADGKALYDGVFTQYGPFYYQAFRALIAPLDLPIGHDTGRIITLTFWIGGSLFLGSAALQVTKSVACGVAAQLISFAALSILAIEPMHPGGLISFLLASLVLTVSTIGTEPANWRMALAGAIVATLTLTKINIGILSAAPFMIAAALFIGPLSRRRWPFLVAACLFLLMPFGLVAGQIKLDAVRLYVAHAAAAGLAFVLVAGAQSRGARPISEAGYFIAGSTAMFAVILGATIFQGTSWYGLLDGILLGPLRHANVYSDHLRLDFRLIYLDLASIVIALIYVYCARSGLAQRRGARTVIGLFAIAVGLAQAFFVCFWIVRFQGIASGFRYDGAPIPFGGNPFSMLSFAWVALLGSREQTSDKALASTVIVGLAIAQSLHAYPVAGSQVGWSTFLLAVVAAMSINAGARMLGSAWPGHTSKYAGYVASVMLVAAAMKFVLLDTYFEGRRLYKSQQRLDLPGARKLRLTPERADRFRKIAAAIDLNCSSFISLPGMNSFYIWTRQKPPTSFNTTFWTSAFTNELQQRIVDQVGAIDGLCLLRNDTLQADWNGVTTPQDRPLWRFVQGPFTEIENLGAGYKLYRR